MKTLAALLLLALETSCTTLANRRDLYSPQPSPEITQAGETTTTRTTKTQREETAPLPQYRY
jgi:hypothetical protein